jgi:hypothetical protein
MTMQTKPPGLTAPLALTLCAALTACGGSSGGSSNPGVQIDADNAATVILSVLMTREILPMSAMMATSMFSFLGAEEDCQNNGSLSTSGDLSGPPPPGSPITLTATQCALSPEQDLEVLLDGALSISADTQQESPSVLLFDYRNFSIEGSQTSGANSLSTDARANGVISLEMQNYTVPASNISFSMTQTINEDGQTQSYTFALQTRDFSAIERDDAGLGDLQHYDGGLRFSAPLHINLAVTTHEGIAYDCTAGDMTIEASNSSVNVRFHEGSALVTINGVQQNFEDCSDFHDWLEASGALPIML